MRKITFEASQAFRNGNTFKSGNTEVTHIDGIVTLKLHGHSIAKRDTFNKLYVTSAGWETATTKERLNGIVGVHVVQKAGQWYLNGEKWENSYQWTLVSERENN